MPETVDAWLIAGLVDLTDIDHFTEVDIEKTIEDIDESLSLEEQLEMILKPLPGTYLIEENRALGSGVEAYTVSLLDYPPEKVDHT